MSCRQKERAGDENENEDPREKLVMAQKRIRRCKKAQQVEVIVHLHEVKEFSPAWVKLWEFLLRPIEDSRTPLEKDKNERKDDNNDL